MKARSLILTTAQKPFTIFGMPPKLFVIVGACGLAVFLLFTSANLKGTALIATFVVMVLGFSYIVRKNRENCHIEQLITIGLPFFKGKPYRQLIPGFPKRKPSKKERAF